MMDVSNLSRSIETAINELSAVGTAADPQGLDDKKMCDAISVRMVADGIRGTRFCSWACPIAEWLMKAVGLQEPTALEIHVYPEIEYVELRYRGDSTLAEFLFPRNLCVFGKAFDNGAFPGLVEFAE